MSMTQGQDTERMRRLLECCTGGNRSGAELELCDWRREQGCPEAVSVLQAALSATTGDWHEATRLLGDRWDVQAGPEWLALRLACACMTGDHRAAEGAAREMHRVHGHEPTVRGWLAALDPVGLGASSGWSTSAVDTLAEQLNGRWDLIEAITFAQAHRPRSGMLSLLRRALVRLIRPSAGQGEAELVLCRSLAKLAMLAGDEDDARRWAERGLVLDPYQASLALVLSWVDDEAKGQRAAEALRMVVEKHPGYRDVAAALRRCEDREQHERRAA